MNTASLGLPLNDSMRVLRKANLIIYPYQAMVPLAVVSLVSNDHL